MKFRSLIPIVSVALMAGAATTFTGCARIEAAMSPTDKIARGRYLVHDVAMCIDCHSPRDERGGFVEAKHLTGSPLPFAPTVPMPVWASAAPGLAGLPAGYSENDMVKFLTSGERPHGKPRVAPPMPEFRMNGADAEAVTAYLKSLATGHK